MIVVEAKDRSDNISYLLYIRLLKPDGYLEVYKYECDFDNYITGTFHYEYIKKFIKNYDTINIYKFNLKFEIVGCINSSPGEYSRLIKSIRNVKIQNILN